MTNPSDIQRRIALKLRLHKIENVGVAGPILVHEVLTKLGHPSRLAQGYCTVSGEESSCWHVITMVENQALDIGCEVCW